MADYPERVTLRAEARARRSGFGRLALPARLLSAIRHPAHAIGLVSLLLLVPLAFYPFARMVRQSFGEPATLLYWRALLLGEASEIVPFWTARHAVVLLWQPLGHSLTIASLTTLLATTLGAVLAGLTTLTDLRFARVIRAIALAHLILPPFALAIAWLTIARAAALPEAWRYGPGPMVLVLTLHFYGFAFLLTGAAMQNLDVALIEAAQVHGASLRAVLRRVALPLLRPALTASAGLIALSSLAAFAPMQVLGGGREPYYVLATQIYSLFRNSRGDPRVAIFAIALALVLTLLSLPALLLLPRLMLPGRYGSLAGRGHRRWKVRLGRWQTPLSLAILLVSLLSLMAPLAILFVQSLPVSGRSVEGWYRDLLSNGHYSLSLASSLLLATVTATVGIVVSLPVAYSLLRTPFRLMRGALYLLVFLPYLLPGIVLGLTWFMMVSQSYEPAGLTLSVRFLYGSLPLAVLICLVQHLPLAVQAHASALLQVDRSLEEAAFLFGASFMRTTRRLFMPLLGGSTRAAWMLLFIFVFKEIDILAFIYAPLPFSTGGTGMQDLLRAPPIMVVLFSMLNSEQEPGLYAQGSALLLLTCLILLLATLAMDRLRWRPLHDSVS